MRQLSRLQILLYNVGGLLLILGVIMPIFCLSESMERYAVCVPYVYTLGAVLFAAMQFLQRYEGSSLTLRRLRRQQLIGALALVVAGALMFCDLYGWGGFGGREWQMAFAIGALLEVYTAFRIPSELKKEEKQ